MNLKHDEDELNFTIHQRSLYGQTVKPLTVRAIIDHITMRQRGAATLSDAERSFLADFGAAKDPGTFIEGAFLDAAINGGKRLGEDSYRLGGEQDEEGEEGGWFGIHRFLGLYVVNSTQYGEGQDLFGPFAKRKEANAIFNLVIILYTPPT
jgi:hypothetical protein